MCLFNETKMPFFVLSIFTVIPLHDEIYEKAAILLCQGVKFPVFF